MNHKYFKLKTINFLKKYIRSVNWYKSKSKKEKKISFSNKKLLVLKNKSSISKEILNQYFKKNKKKLNRLNKKNYFLILVSKNKLLSSGWIYFGAKWRITEINKRINLNSQVLLYDFETPSHLQNMGYYKILLKLIRYKFKNKRLVIYSLSSNIKSIRAIEKSGFELVKKINGLRN